MKRAIGSIGVVLAIFFMMSCGSSSSSGVTTAADYAVFGATVSNAIPAGLKTSNPSANISALIKDLQAGVCSSSYQSCPSFTQTGGADSATGEILLRLWSLDYNSECTADYLADGTCIDCPECETGGYGSNFIKPTMLASPTSCAATETSSARYVNFGVDPCFFDMLIAQIPNMATCASSTGRSVDISSAIPWHASWGLPQFIEFSGSTSTARDGATGGFWWTVDEGDAGTSQYFLSIDDNWLHAGIKDPDNDRFMIRIASIL